MKEEKGVCQRGGWTEVPVDPAEENLWRPKHCVGSYKHTYLLSISEKEKQP